MEQVELERPESAPLAAANAGGIFHWVCTKNPFYVISAGLFLTGLWISFAERPDSEGAWALMAGLASYTLLLAGTAWLLVRFGNVWDDVRTVLLLVVLMFLATSVTFDDVLVRRPQWGAAYVYYLGGFLFAVLVSEGLFRGIRLGLPILFRLPYYLILALFFLYPLALSTLVRQPQSELLLWGLFGFSPAAGLVFLTLLPAARLGPAYVRNNGSPWRWPLYPWTLFGMLGLAVPARTFLLCWSMHWIGFADLQNLIFGPYFLVPFGLALSVLLVEIGFHPMRRGVLGAALFMPVGLLILTLIGHRPDHIYQGFLELFRARLGGDPLFLTLLATVFFYAYATVRRVPHATEALTLALVTLAFVGPSTLMTREFVMPQPMPIVIVAALQMLLGLGWRNSWRFLAGTIGMVLATYLVFPENSYWRLPVSVHLGLLMVLLVGAAFRDSLGMFMRVVGAVLTTAACLTAMFAPLPETLPGWLVTGYVPVMAVMLALYGLFLGSRLALALTGTIVISWLLLVGSQAYLFLRLLILGLDYIALSLVLLAVAILTSFTKSGHLNRWIAHRRGGLENSTE